jgi:hypothetical protein
MSRKAIEGRCCTDRVERVERTQGLLELGGADPAVGRRLGLERLALAKFAFVHLARPSTAADAALDRPTLAGVRSHAEWEDVSLSRQSAFRSHFH